MGVVHEPVIRRARPLAALCAEKDHAVARYALEGLPNKVMAAEYRTALPDEATLVEAVERSQRALGATASKQKPR